MVGAISYDPIITIEIGPLGISPHGLGIAVGFLVGAWFLLPRTRARSIPDDLVHSLLTRAAIGALVGARLAYVANHLGDYESLGEILAVWEGGISLLGGIVGAILAAMPAMRRHRLSFWKVMDAAAPPLALGIGIGRIGDLVVGDHLGKVTDFVLGYRCPDASVETASPCAPTALATRTVGAVVHQTALYDLVFALALFAVLAALARRDRFDGFLVAAFGLGYGAARLVEDFLREDLRRFGLTGSQWTALVTILACLVVLVVTRRTPRWGNWDAGGPTLGPAPASPAVVAPAAPPGAGDGPGEEGDPGGEEGPRGASPGADPGASGGGDVEGEASRPPAHPRDA